MCAGRSLLLRPSWGGVLRHSVFVASDFIPQLIDHALKLFVLVHHLHHVLVHLVDLLVVRIHHLREPLFLSVLYHGLHLDLLLFAKHLVFVWQSLLFSWAFIVVFFMLLLGASWVLIQITEALVVFLVVTNIFLLLWTAFLKFGLFILFSFKALLKLIVVNILFIILFLVFLILLKLQILQHNL